ncbi:hypothetical protein CDAR_189811 [Caerostris darwini]|uniref:Uncharacterized protein n=1 Tax=Caerostris darwini TaxID=1538125 RepID=A0AAV4VME9_9ARAC|nr:hypothetical protein CDAR_189811 [Caerostris darwini]
MPVWSLARLGSLSSIMAEACLKVPVGRHFEKLINRVTSFLITNCALFRAEKLHFATIGDFIREKILGQHPWVGGFITILKTRSNCLQTLPRISMTGSSGISLQFAYGRRY